MKEKVIIGLLLLIIIGGIFYHVTKIKSVYDTTNAIANEYQSKLTGSESTMEELRKNNIELRDKVNKSASTIRNLEADLITTRRRLQEIREGLSGATDTNSGIFDDAREAGRIIEQLQSGSE